jgi:hypothetical protein
VELHNLIDLQSAILNEYNHNIWTTYGMYVLAIGWIMTSDKSRSFLLTNPAVSFALALAAVLTLFIEIGVLFYLWYRSERLYRYIQTCDVFKSYDGQSTSKLILLEINRVTIRFPIISSIITAILCFSLITMIFHRKESRDTMGQQTQ